MTQLSKLMATVGRPAATVRHTLLLMVVRKSILLSGWEIWVNAFMINKSEVIVRNGIGAKKRSSYIAYFFGPVPELVVLMTAAVGPIYFSPAHYHQHYYHYHNHYNFKHYYHYYHNP